MIDDLGLHAILDPVGSVRPAGSFELGLMVWPDLDLEVITPDLPRPENVVGVLRDLVLVSGVRKINYADHRDAVGGELPRGIYLGPDPEFLGVRWQVDVWFIDEDQAEERRRLTETIRDRMNDGTRRTIQQIKQIAAASDRYHRGVSSVDIYRAVLDEGVTSMDGFVTYLARTGREL
ncbi:MAG: hypothetical protein J2P23_08425 [Microlunatus sp.]|nr:hypothetical protein [Microlunatus sp.]